MTHSAIGVRACGRCGSALESRALFCASCGAAVPKDLWPADPVTRPKAWFEQDAEVPDAEVPDAEVPAEEAAPVERTLPVGIRLTASTDLLGPATAPIPLPVPGVPGRSAVPTGEPAPTPSVVLPATPVAARSAGLAEPPTGPMSLLPTPGSAWSPASQRSSGSASLAGVNARGAATPATEFFRPSSDSDLVAPLVRPPISEVRVVDLGAASPSPVRESVDDLTASPDEFDNARHAPAGSGPDRSGFTRAAVLRVAVPALAAVLAMAGVLMVLRSRTQDAGVAQSGTSAGDPRAAAVRAWQDGNAAWSRGDITLLCDRYDGVGTQGMWSTTARCQAAEQQGFQTATGADRASIGAMAIDPTTAQALGDGSVVIWYRNARVGAGPVRAGLFRDDDFAVMRQLDGQGWRQVGARYSGKIIGWVPVPLRPSTSPTPGSSPTPSP